MNICLPFFDDSTLIFAGVMGRHMAARGHNITLTRLVDRENPALDQISKRQLDLHLQGVDYSTIYPDEIIQVLSDQDSLIFSKVPKSASAALADPEYRGRKDRPCYIAFQPGLEFTPHRGFQNRRQMDAVFLTNRQHIDIVKKANRPNATGYISSGHPYFLTPKKPFGNESTGDIVFFTQAISPSSLAGRLHMLDIMAAIARRNPDRKVLIKLRHLNNENVNHVHKELYPYQDILAEGAESLPENVEFLVCSMEEALARASFCITCTSTAAMDSLSAGIPTSVYTDYKGYYEDRHAKGMNSEFEESGIISSLTDLLNLRVKIPRKDWMQRYFRGDDLFVEIEGIIAEFREHGRIHSETEPSGLTDMNSPRI